MIKNGKTIARLSLDQFIGKGVLIDARGKTSVDESLLEDVTIKSGTIVLINTGFYKKYKTPAYYENYPLVTPGFALKMVETKARIVGMDILGPDQPPFPTHKILLSNNILIIENLTNLDALLGVKEFDIIAYPAKYDAEGAPVRVIAKIND